MENTITFTKQEVEKIEEALLLIGVELSNSREDYTWTTELSKKFTYANNILKKKTGR